MGRSSVFVSPSLCLPFSLSIPLSVAFDHEPLLGQLPQKQVHFGDGEVAPELRDQLAAQLARSLRRGERGEG
jgi:hypothetical protein